MRCLVMIVAAAILVSLTACSNGNSSGSPSAPSTSSTGTLEEQTHTKINEYRVSRGLPALTWNDGIAAQARQHSQNMAGGTTPFGHDGFDNRTATIGQSIPWISAGENVAMNSGQSDPVAAAVDGWLNSPGHRENIEGNFNLTGVGAAAGRNGSVYFTQIFVKAR